MSPAVSTNLDTTSDAVLVSGERQHLVYFLPALSVGLADVTGSDSAGLALLVRWMNCYRCHKQT